MTEHTIEDYEVVRELGQGGFGVVFEARSPEGERVAIKMLHEHLVSDSTIVQRFFQEALIMARLEHPAIPKVHHFGPYEVTHYLVQEFVEGRELEDVIGDKPMSPPEAVAVMEQLLDGLGYAHKEEIVHRDLKPANLILKEDGKLKILDFGIAKIIGGAQLTAPGIVNVTLGYASPEQLIGASIDGRADIFAAGVLFHQLLTGEIPCKPVGKDPIKAYQAQIEWSRSERIPITRDHPELPDWVDAFYQRCTAPEAADRFVDAQAAREFLLASAPPADLRPRINRGPKRALTAEDIQNAPATEMMDIEAASLDGAGPDITDNKTAQLNIDDASTATFDIANQATVSLDVGAAMPPQPLAITPPPPQAASVGNQRTLVIVAAVLGLLVVAAFGAVTYLFMVKTPPPPPDIQNAPAVIDTEK